MRIPIEEGDYEVIYLKMNGGLHELVSFISIWAGSKLGKPSQFQFLSSNHRKEIYHCRG